MSGAMAPREVTWLPVDRDRQFDGRWVELTYAASFLFDPVRPTLRFRLPVGDEFVVLPAPVCGRGIWRGRFLPGAEIAIDPGPGIAPDRFRIEPIKILRIASVAARAALSPRTGLMGLVQQAAGGREGGRRKLATVLHDEPLESYDIWRRARRREPEPAGLDRLTEEIATAAPIRFVGGDASHRGWRETLKSLQRQLCVRWELVLTAASAEELTELKADKGYAAELRLVIETAGVSDHSSDPAATLVLEPGDRVAPEAVAAIIAALARAPDAGTITFDEDEPGLSARARRPLFRWPRPLAAGCRAARRAGASAVRHHVARVLIYRAAPERALIARPAALSPVDLPLVDIVVPTRDRADMLTRCVGSLLERTRYRSFRLIIADNDSVDPPALRFLDKVSADPRVTVVPAPGPFNFAAVCNKAAAVGRGALLVFLNNDVEVLDGGWLEALALQVMQPDVGAAGAKLIYPQGAIQHAGIVLGLHGAAGHFYRGARRTEPGYQGALASAHCVSAVTGACLAVRRSLFETLDGFDEVAFPIEYNDVDLCLRLGRLGYATVWTPEAELVHLESASRGRPSLARRSRHVVERGRFIARWGDMVANDPNFHPAFSLAADRPRLA